MKVVPREIRNSIGDYVRTRLAKREEIDLAELNQYLIENCEVEFVDDELLYQLVINAKKGNWICMFRKGGVIVCIIRMRTKKLLKKYQSKSS